MRDPSDGAAEKEQGQCGVLRQAENARQCHRREIDVRLAVDLLLHGAGDALREGKLG